MKETGIGDLLVRSGVVDAAGLARARKAQEKSGLPLSTTLATLGLADEQEVITAIATSMRLEALGPELRDVEAEVAALLPAEFCRKRTVAALLLHVKIVRLAVADSMDYSLIT